MSSQNYFDDCNIFFEESLHGTYVYLLNISTNVNDYVPPPYHIYPTPPLGQDMTQGQFLSGL